MAHYEFPHFLVTPPLLPCSNSKPRNERRLDCHKLENFPVINQRQIEGATDRCGTITLSAWIKWLTDQKALPTPGNLQSQQIPVILFHGIYGTDPNTGQLQRTKGHYTCLIGQTEEHLIANTYAINYPFTLKDLPMTQLNQQDRYKPSGLESMIYLRRPETNTPRYRFRSFAAEDKAHAKLQLNTGGQIFAEPNETILLEGALVFQISKEQK